MSEQEKPLSLYMRPGNRKVAGQASASISSPKGGPAPSSQPTCKLKPPDWEEPWALEGLMSRPDQVEAGPYPWSLLPSLLTARSRHPATPGATLPKLACSRRSDQAHLGPAQADLGLSPLGT